MPELTVDQVMQSALQHHHVGRLQEAGQLYEQILARQPNHAEALHHLGAIAHQVGRNEIAVALIRRAITIGPEVPEAFSNLGNALSVMGQFDEAIAAHRRAIALNTNLPEAHFNLGSALGKSGKTEEAIAAYRQAIALRPTYAEAHSNLGNVLKGVGCLDEAIAVYREAISLRPDYAEAQSNLGVALKDQGRIEDARIALERAAALRPNDATFLDNLLFALYYHPDYSAEAIAREHRNWNERHGRPLEKFAAAHTNSPDPNRRLKIGYVSPDFRDHVVGRNVLPLLREHDPDQFQVYCYANSVERPDDRLTECFRAYASEWRNITSLSDEEVAQRVREDGIDILVDLALHTARNRLPVFARKPAPVQVTFAGYPGTTGMYAMHYRLTDPYLDPLGAGGDCYAEYSVRLSDSFWCYDPSSMMLGLDPWPQVSPLPALQNGLLTLGCLNNFAKVNGRVLDLWARVMKALPTSRLILGAFDGSHRRDVMERFRDEGVDPKRIEFVAPCARQQYMARYHRIDVGLDTFPYNGHTTSLDALWMGVPVVTLVGQTVVGRAGLSQLSNLGLTDLVAHTPDQYVEIVVRLASDLPKLAELRSTLRERMLQSPLTDAVGFTRNIESAYREMWRRWCEGGGTVKGN